MGTQPETVKRGTIADSAFHCVCETQWNASRDAVQLHGERVLANAMRHTRR